MDGTLENIYRNWLVQQVNIVEGYNYGPLLNELYRMEFYWTISNDEDRAMDGTALRDDFGDEMGIEEQLYFGPAKVLEVLIGMAKRVEFQLFGRPYMDDWMYEKVFWDLIMNLDLIDLSGTLSDEEYDKIHENVTLFMERKKKGNKNCNVFGLGKEVKNLSKMNFWTQMMIYIRQKWPF